MTGTCKQHLIFDLDDTLVYCNKYFDLILDEFFSLMTGWFSDYGLSVQEVRDKQLEIDIAGVHVVGFASHHFPESLIATYRHFASVYKRIGSDAEEAALMKLGLSVYDYEVEAYPGMVDTLEVLRSEGHALYLYTGGEEKIQQRKIDQMKLSSYFGSDIFIRQHKNVQALEGILGARSLPRPSTWMIGNSLRTDIAPALSADINAVYLKQEREWAYNLIELNEHSKGTLHTVSRLPQVPEIISDFARTSFQKRTL
ncbi:HAD family hydrolase [Saccharibacillus sp. CPCC 101409]|uniref:HAD family hydrolase n=1 Tax=Saccharibacillus sp. CPCC 101409 TaxID=3058041 RepID=UPI002671F2E5|nr:HAD family hydrolase [Saccharibacillus sp. CPCC 101409]MDO3412863.1 HAD family hydrolase [Saccharibacillus sp. CPCC 101409]